MHVYFNNNSFTWGEPLMDVFSKAVSGCRSKGRAEQPQLRLWVRDWSCSSQDQQDHVLFSTPSHVLSSTSSVMPAFSIEFAQLTNYKLGPEFCAVGSVAQPKHVPRDAHSAPHLSLGFQTHSSWFSSALVEFGLLSYFHYLTQSIYHLTVKTQSQPHKPPHIIFDSTNLWEELLNPI